MADRETATAPSDGSLDDTRTDRPDDGWRGEAVTGLGWRLCCWFPTVVAAAVVGVVLQQALVAAVPVGPIAALAAIVGSIGVYAGMTGVTLGFVRYVDRRRLVGIGLPTGGSRRRRFAGALAVGLLLGLAMATLVFLATVGTGLVRVVEVLVADPAASVVPGETGGSAVVGTLEPLAVIALLVPFFVAVGVAEEVLVRGYLLTNLADGLGASDRLTARSGTAIAILATGGLFGALHLANPHATLLPALTITAIGIVLGWAYVVSGDLGIPIGIHVTWNLTLGPIFGFPVSGIDPPASVLAVAVTGEPLLVGGDFGPEAGLVVVLPLLLAVVGTLWWVRRTGGDRTPRLALRG